MQNFDRANTLVLRIMNVIALYILKISGKIFEYQLKIIYTSPKVQ